MADQSGVTHDVTLDGAGYMFARSVKNYYVKETSGDAPSVGLKSGTGREEMQGYPQAESEPFRRVSWTDWKGGSGRYFMGKGDVERGEFGGAVAELAGLRPVLGGSALMLALGEVVGAYGATGATHFGSIIYNGTVYVVKDGAVYSVATSGSDDFAGLTLVGSLPLGGTVSSCGYDASGLAWACYGANAALINNPATLLGKQASHIAAYQNLTFRSVASAASLEWIVNGVTQGYNFGSKITALCVHQGALWAGTEAGLWRLEGTLQESDPKTAPGVYDKFVYTVQKIVDSVPDHLENYPECGNWRQLTSCDGALWGCRNGRLARVTTHNGFSYELEEQRLPYGWIWSITTAVNCLFVALEAPGRGRTAWGYDPAIKGWWMVGPFVNGPGLTELFSGGGLVRDSALLGLHNGTDKISRWAFSATNMSGLDQTNFGSSWPDTFGSVILPLLTPEDLARQAGQNVTRFATAQLVRVGVEWEYMPSMEGWYTWPAPDSSGTAFFRIDISLDGSNWTTLINEEGIDEYIPPAANRNTGMTDWIVPPALGLLDISAQYTDPTSLGQPGYGWRIRFYANGPVTAPIRRLWLDYRLVEVKPHLGLRWKMALDLGRPATTVGLDGNTRDYDPETLWQLYKDATVFDLVEPKAGVSYRVQITGIKEEQSSSGTMPTERPNVIMQLELSQVAG